MEVIATHDLCKVYGERTEALRGVNISCESGRLYCLVGPNGAGKTTLLRILTTQLLPTRGDAYVMGFDVVQEAEEIRRRIAVVPQDVRPASSMTVWQHVYWYLVSRGYALTQAKRDAEAALKLLDLWDVRDRYAGTLSGGQRKRIIVAMTLGTDAQVLFLDEPTAGLDPMVRRDVWGSLREKVRRGQSIFLTTHYMEEAEMLADSILMLNKGEIVASGPLSELKTVLKHTVKVVLEGIKGVGEFEGYGEVSTIGDRVVVYPDGDRRLKQLVAEATARDLTLTIQPVDLEDVFINRVGEKT